LFTPGAGRMKKRHCVGGLLSEGKKENVMKNEGRQNSGNLRKESVWSGETKKSGKRVVGKEDLGMFWGGS